MVWDLGEGKLHHRPLKATQKLFYDISLVISMVTGEGWGLGGGCSSPFLDSAFQQQMTARGQLGYLIASQECGRKAGRDVMAVRQVGCSLHPRG